MPNDFSNGRAASTTAPAGRLVPVAPNDAADLSLGVCRGLYVGGAGTLVVRDAFGGQAALPTAAFQYHPIRVSRVMATGTTATDVVALY